MSSLGVDRLWRSAAVHDARLRRGDRVLDLCAGTGDLTLALARADVASEVVGSDFVPEMLSIAREKAEKHKGLTSITIREADAQSLPFADHSFDVVTVAFGVRNLPSRSANFSEVRRVLRPGGRYVILEFSRPRFAPFRGLYHFYLRSVIPAIGGMLTRDRDSFVYLNDSILQFPTQTQLAAELRNTGFSAISWRDLTGGIVAIHVAVT
jgi:demethylmenaquinone methyltransferase/2-methoxy-6-polyprenyl-1,4-benzoquinol methylase